MIKLDCVEICQRPRPRLRAFVDMNNFKKFTYIASERHLYVGYLSGLRYAVYYCEKN